MSMYFGCHQCGKCCNSSPVLMFEEIEKFSEKFIIEVNCSSVYTKWFDADYTKKKPLQEHALATKDSDGREVLISVFPVAYTFPNGSGCSKLNQDGSCSIYEDNPEICSMVPLSINLSDKNQFTEPKLNQLFIREGCLSTIKKDGLDIIHDGRKIVKRSYVDSRLKIIEDLKDHRDVVASFVQIVSLHDESFGVPVMNKSSRSHFLFLLIAMLLNKKVSKATVIQICDSQKRMIDEALVFVRRSEKDESQTIGTLSYYSKLYENKDVFIENYIGLFAKLLSQA